MTIVLTLKQASIANSDAGGSTAQTSIDASGISLSAMLGQSDLQIGQLPIVRSVPNQATGCIGDYFLVSRQELPRCDLLLRGDLSGFRHLAATHDAGVIEIDGDAGDWLGGATKGRAVGMSGGRVLVRGDAGANVGYRMRRGEILVAGDTGDFLAAHQIAGTIVVAGSAVKNPHHLGYAMRRGSLLLNDPPELPTARFSPPHLTCARWVGLLTKTDVAKLNRLLEKLSNDRCWSCRGDDAAGGFAAGGFAAGFGEILWPAG